MPWHWKLPSTITQANHPVESLKSAVSATTLNCYFASVNLKDAYYSIKIRAMDRKILLGRVEKAIVFIVINGFVVLAQMFYQDP